MKFKVDDIVRSVYNPKRIGTIVHTFDCPLGAAYDISWDNGDYSVGNLDHQLTLSAWDDFREKVNDRLGV